MPTARETFAEACRQRGFEPTEAEIAEAGKAIAKAKDEAVYTDAGPRQFWAAVEEAVEVAASRRAGAF